METAPSICDRRAGEGRWRWVVAVATSSIVATAAFLFALQQFFIKYLYDQSSYTRTPAGILLIVLGFCGICLPVALLYSRRRFAAQRPSLQWVWAVGLPTVYVLVLAVCLEVSHRSRTILLPRPFAPTAIVHYRPGDCRVEFRGGWRRDVGLAGYNDAEIQPDGSEEFSSHLAEHFIRDATGGRETVTILGRAKLEQDGFVRIVLEVDAKEAIRFAIDNLDDVTITRDGQPLVESKSQLGTFQITITGRPKQNT